MSFKAKKITNDHQLGGFMDSFDADRGYPEISDQAFDGGASDGYGPGLDNSPPVDQGNSQPDGGYSCSNCAPQPAPVKGWVNTQPGNVTVPTTASEARKRSVRWFSLASACDKL